jgi:hypothetical protein
LPGEPEAMQAELRVAARREHDPEQARPPGQQYLELCERLRRSELVQVVDHQHDRLLQRLELGPQTLDHRCSFELGLRREPLHESLGADRGAQLLDQRKPEALRVLLVAIHQHPGGPIAQTGLVEPRAQQDGLPAPRRCGDERHGTGALGSRERLEQRFARDHRWRNDDRPLPVQGCRARRLQASPP